MFFDFTVNEPTINGDIGRIELIRGSKESESQSLIPREAGKGGMRDERISWA